MFHPHAGEIINFRGIGTATPTTRYTKAECLVAFENSAWFARLDARAHFVTRAVLQRDNGIEARRLAVDSLDEVSAIDPNTLALRAGDAVEALLQRDCRGVRRALQAASRAGPWLAAGPLDPGVRLRADDRLFRIGNAAGEAHPIIGEGMEHGAAIRLAQMTTTKEKR